MWALSIIKAIGEAYFDYEIDTCPKEWIKSLDESLLILNKYKDDKSLAQESEKYIQDGLDLKDNILPLEIHRLTEDMLSF